MRIICAATGMVAEKVDGLYQCYPPSEANRGASVRFSTIEKAAAYLCENADWGIFMGPDGVVVYEGIVIERDA